MFDYVNAARQRQKLSFPKSSPRELADGFDLACHDHELTKFVSLLEFVF